MYMPATPLGSADMFVDPLGLPQVLLPVTAPDPGNSGVSTDFYNVDVTQHAHRFSSRLPAETQVWGYAARPGQQATLNPASGYLDGIILAKKGKPVRINFQNLLPPQNLIPVDPTIVGYPKDSNGFVHNATAVHLHGGHVPWQCDGHPLSWFAPSGVCGSYFDPAKPLSAAPWTGNVGYDFWYPNDQSARLMWYHEHAVGLTRINAYNGIATAYILRDDVEAAMVAKGALPPLLSHELFLVIQDKAFNAEGSLWYPSAPDPESLREGTVEIPFPSCVPEMMGDVNVVNGTVWPKVNVDRCRYRVRMLNGAQSRFYRLRLFYALADGITPDFSAPGPPFWQFGTESGFLRDTVPLNDNPNPFKGRPLLLAPAERTDMIVDFSGCPAGSKLILWNDAPAPFPVGTFPVYGLPMPADPAFLKEGCVMRFDVQNTAAETPAGRLPRVPLANELWPTEFPKFQAKKADAVFNYTLNEGFDEYGRLAQFIGGTTPPGIGDSPFGQPFLDPDTGVPVAYESHKAGDVEIWNIINVSADTHPMHTHLVDFQVVSRQPFDVETYIATQQLVLLNRARAPEKNELGFKETVQCPPGEITTIIMRINPQPAWVANQTAHYVWHCHILEHEEHDMMHTLVVT
jgi:spore coat protein A